MTKPITINNYITNNYYNINIFRFEDKDFKENIQDDNNTSEDIEVEYISPIIVKPPNKLKKLFKKIKNFFK